MTDLERNADVVNQIGVVESVLGVHIVALKRCGCSRTRALQAVKIERNVLSLVRSVSHLHDYLALLLVHYWKADLVDEHFYRDEHWFLSHGLRYEDYDRKF